MLRIYLNVNKRKPDMKNETIVFYIISMVLISITTLQRSKNEELMDEQETLLLPVITFLGFLGLYFLLSIINARIINFCILISFSFFGYLTLISNAFYLYEFATYEIETNIYDAEIDSSEFEEIVIHEHSGNNIKKIKKKFNLKKYIKKKFSYAKKLFIHMTIVDFIIYLASFILVSSFYFTQNHIIAEIIVVSFCFHGVREIKLDSVINGYTHLAIMIFYDLISLIFYERISKMIDGIKVPIKLILPKRFAGYEMFGMGDIFIPALFIAVVKRYGEKTNFRIIYPITLCGLCVGVALVIYLYRNIKTKNPGMICICVILGLFPAILTLAKFRFKEFLFFKRKHPFKNT